MPEAESEEPAAPEPPVVARPAPKPVVPPVVQKVVAEAEEPETPPPPAAVPSAASVAHAEVKTTGEGKAEVVVHLSTPKKEKKPSPTDEALKKAKAEAGEAKKKVERAEGELSKAKKDYDEKRGEVKKLRKQKDDERKQEREAKSKNKPKAAPVLTVQTSPDLAKRLQDSGKGDKGDKDKGGKGGKKVTISVSAHSG
ncbi:hypothetical protein ACQPW3_23545 [Actinosynnema sp. CA-248983]